MSLAEAYKLLDVPAGTRDADVLKKAFRKKAQIHHPDRDGGNEEHFKKVKEAYELLTNPSKQQNRVYGGNAHDVHFDPDVEELVRQYYRTTGGSFHGFNLNMPIRINKVITLEQAFAGGDIVVNAPGITETITLPLQPGVVSGAQFQGSVDSPNGPKVVIVTILIANHDTFTLVGNDLTMSITAPLIDFYTRGKIKIRTIEGTDLAIKIPENFQPGNVLRVKEKGYNMNGQRGNILLTINVELPKMTETQVEKLQELLNG